jgi:hypothetical protein
MAAARKGRKPTQNQTAALLVSALDFLSVVPDRKDNPNMVVINGAFISVNNGLLKAQIKIGEDFPSDTLAKVPMKALKGALSRVGKEMSIAFTDESVSIEAGAFNADLANDPINDTDRVIPDPYIAPLNNGFRDAMGKVAVLVSDSGDELLVSTIALLGPTVMATKRHTVIEAWHGNDMPYNMIFVPKAFATALGGVKANITGFGFGPATMTVHYDNGAFLQTNTFNADAWAVEGKAPTFILDTMNKLLSDGEGTVILNTDALTEAIKTISVVTQADFWCTLGKIESIDGMASLEVKELVAEFGGSIPWYLAVADFIKSAKVVKEGTPRMLFWGDNLRGVMAVDTDRSAMMNAEPAPAPATSGAAPAWAAPPTAGWGPPPATDPTTPAAASGTPPMSAPATTPASTSPASGSGLTVPPTAFPSSTGAGLFDD